MTNRRIFLALQAVRDSMPAFDAEAMNWARTHNLFETRSIDGMLADVLTVAGTKLLNMTELYFSELLKRFHETGQLRRPQDNGTQDHHDNTDQQERHSRQGKKRKGGVRNLSDS